MNELGKNITVSADDFGISKIASENILKLVESGKLDRVEVMMSHNITQEKAKILLDSGVKIDIHFHLAKDKLDIWQDRKEEYVENSLKRIIVFVAEYFFSRDKIRETKNEWNLQLEDFRKVFGKYPDGIGSHEHIHFFPAYFKIMMEIASKNDIIFVRFGKKSFGNFHPVSLILNFLRFFNLSYFKKFGSQMKTTDFFVSFDWIKNNSNPLKCISLEKETELVFHPERPDEFEFLEKFSKKQE
jgi:predicted glycoside hydrolase/deacetylase ChbG (UPF0249 family)